MLFNTAKEIPIIRSKIEKREMDNKVVVDVKIDQESIILSDTPLPEELAPLNSLIDNTEEAMTPPTTIIIEKDEELLATPVNSIRESTQEIEAARCIDSLPDIAKRLYVRSVSPTSIDLSRKLK